MLVIKTILATLALVSLGYGVLVFLAGSASDDPQKAMEYRSAGGMLVIGSIAVFVGAIVWAFHY